MSLFNHHEMQTARSCQPVEGLTRGPCHQTAVKHITWYPGQGCAVKPQHGGSLILTTVEGTCNLVSVGLCPKLLPPLDKKQCIVFHLGAWVMFGGLGKGLPTSRLCIILITSSWKIIVWH